MPETTTPATVERLTPQVVSRPGMGVSRLGRQTRGSLARLEQETILRMADTQATGMVQRSKMLEVDHLAREAISGQAMLSHWAGTLAQDNAMLYEELRYFVGVARIGKGQIIADTVDDFCRESTNRGLRR